MIQTKLIGMNIIIRISVLLLKANLFTDFSEKLRMIEKVKFTQKQSFIGKF